MWSCRFRPHPPDRVPASSKDNASGGVQCQLQRRPLRLADVLQGRVFADQTVQAGAEIHSGERSNLRYVLAERDRALHTGGETRTRFSICSSIIYVTFPTYHCVVL